MIVDLIDKLIDRVIHLVETEKKQRKELFEQFVDPVFKLFEEVHKDYLESFERYRKLLSDPTTDITIVIETIRKDNLFTQNQRAKLKALADVSEDSVVDPFVRYLHLYLTIPDFYGTSPGDPEYKKYFYLSQRWRQGLLHEFETDKVKTKDHAIAKVD
jgi:uncharacterized protein with ParB-like and HNH nuclease domain